MSARIGEVARRVGTTPRTIRYYEEIGLLPAPEDRPAGGHRVYDEDAVERLAEALRLKELLGLTLDELRDLVAAQDARAARREEWFREDTSPRRRREILDLADAHLTRVLAHVRRRRLELGALEEELLEQHARVTARLAEADQDAAAASPGA